MTANVQTSTVASVAVRNTCHKRDLVMLVHSGTFGLNCYSLARRFHHTKMLGPKDLEILFNCAHLFHSLYILFYFLKRKLCLSLNTLILCYVL